MGPLFHHTSKSKESHSALKAKLTKLAHSSCGTPIGMSMINFTMHRECFQAIKSLRNNSDIIITKADKSNVVVILNKSDYLTKMNVTLDSQKFQKIGPGNKNDNTARIEGQRRLLALTKENMLAKSVYEYIRPSGSQTPRMNGLPKTLKKDVPLRPILSMVGLAQHKQNSFRLPCSPFLICTPSTAPRTLSHLLKKCNSSKLILTILSFAPMISLVFSPMYHWLKLCKSVMTLSTMVNCLPSIFKRNFH